MNADQYVEILSRGKYRIMIEMTMGFAGQRIGRDKGTFATILDSPLQLARRLFRIAERNVGDGHQPPQLLKTAAPKR